MKSNRSIGDLRKAAKQIYDSQKRSSNQAQFIEAFSEGSFYEHGVMQNIITSKDNALKEVISFLNHIEPKIGEQAFNHIYSIVENALINKTL